MERRLLLVSFLEPWSIGKNVGAPILFETVKGYIEAGWSVTFLTSDKRFLSGGSHEENIDIGIPSVEVIRIRIPAWQKFVGTRIQAKLERVFLFARFARKAVLALLRERSFDLIYAYEEAAVAAVSSIHAGQKPPVVHRFQGTILGGKFRNRLHCLRKYETWSALRARADMYIMTNDGTFGDLALKYWNGDVNDTNLLFIRNGIDTDIASLRRDRLAVLPDYGVSPGDRFLLTVSRLAHWKRVDRAIHVTSHLASRWTDLQLVVCGDGESRADLESLACQLNIADRVHFVGAQPRQKVAELMNVCDVFLSLYDISNCGNPLFEAMLCGRPVVTLDNGSTGQVVDDGVNGRLLPVIDDDAAILSGVFLAVDELLADQELRTKLGDGARQWAARNLATWEDRMGQEISWVEEHIERVKAR